MSVGREPFAPIDRATYTISVTTSNTATTLTQAPLAEQFQVMLYNAGSVVVFVRFGGVATTADVPIAPGATTVLTSSAGQTLGAITGSSTATLYCTVGSGY
jgi:hypothetical protein